MFNADTDLNLVIISTQDGTPTEPMDERDTARFAEGSEMMQLARDFENETPTVEMPYERKRDLVRARMEQLEQSDGVPDAPIL